MQFSRRVVACVMGAVCLATVSASAEPPVDQPKEKPFEWKGNRVGLFEVGATGALALGFGAANVFLKDGDAKWKGGILMDDAMSSALRAGSQAGRDRASRISDYLLYGMIAWPYIDAGVATMRNPDVGWQLAVINTEAFALNGLLTTLVKRTVLRERPFVAHCQGGNCGPSSESFFSGHASTTFTAAGLICAQHQVLGTYGNKLADGAACATALTAATATGMLRIVADKHYTTDVLAGAAVGLASGYVFPMLMHWTHLDGGKKSSDPMDAKKMPKPNSIHITGVSPVPVAGGGMITLSGIMF